MAEDQRAQKAQSQRFAHGFNSISKATQSPRCVTSKGDYSGSDARLLAVLAKGTHDDPLVF
jgi:hypothetical protein